MQYSKPPLSFEAQADLLLQRGLNAERQVLVQRLQTVNYYRLSGYLFPFHREDDTYNPGTTLDQIWAICTFDRQMHIITMDAIERIEVAVRTQLAYHFARKYGPFEYISNKYLPGINQSEQDKWLNDLRAEVSCGNKVFIRHFMSKYGDVHNDLPIWMLTEVMSFGKTLTFFRGVNHEIQQVAAKRYGIPHNVLESWLRSLNAIRNIYAHHGRLWNRTLGYKPQLPNRRKHSLWYSPFGIPQDKLFSVLTILNYLLKVDASTSKWKIRLFKFIDDHSQISMWPYGFPAEWKKHQLWI